MLSVRCRRPVAHWSQRPVQGSQRIHAPVLVADCSEDLDGGILGDQIGGRVEARQIRRVVVRQEDCEVSLTVPARGIVRRCERSPGQVLRVIPPIVRGRGPCTSGEGSLDLRTSRKMLS